MKPSAGSGSTDAGPKAVVSNLGESRGARRAPGIIDSIWGAVNGNVNETNRNFLNGRLWLLYFHWAVVAKTSMRVGLS